MSANTIGFLGRIWVRLHFVAHTMAPTLSPRLAQNACKVMLSRTTAWNCSKRARDAAATLRRLGSRKMPSMRSLQRSVAALRYVDFDHRVVHMWALRMRLEYPNARCSC